MTQRRPFALVAMAIAALTTPLWVSAPALAADVAPSAAETSSSDWTLREDVDLSDSSRWTLETGQAENTLSYDRPQNVRFSDSGLTVTGERRAWKGRPYTSGDAKGTGIVIPNYARVEAVGTTPRGSGLWPALLWLRPHDSAHGEIDLMEVFGDDARVSATIHNQYGAGHRSHKGSVAWAALANSSAMTQHTYVMEKTPDRIVISVDGVVMLDAGPEDVPRGFDWDAIFERPSATWYPRVTMQIGCGAALTGCTVGTPGRTWQKSDMTLSSLRVWAWTPGSGTPTPPAEPSKPAPVEPAKPAPTPAPTAPSEPAPRPGTPSTGATTLRPGQLVTRSYPAPAGGADRVDARFSVPANLGTGVFYPSVELVDPQPLTGYRATAVIKEKGNLYLTVSRVDGRRSAPVVERMVLPDGSYRPGDRIVIELDRSGGVVLARAWVDGSSAPNWQLRAWASGSSAKDNSVPRVTAYLSQAAPNRAWTRWTAQSS